MRTDRQPWTWRDDAIVGVLRIAFAGIAFVVLTVLIGIATVAVAALVGCAPVVGSDPIVHEATARDCEPPALTGDHEADIRRAFDELEDRAVRVVYRDVGSGATAWPGRLALSPNWHDKTPEQQARLLQHERAHYCDQDDRGELQFLVDWGSPKGRLILEVRGAVAQAAAVRQQGGTPEQVEAELRRFFAAFPTRYRVEVDAAWWWERLFTAALAAAMAEELDR